MIEHLLGWPSALARFATKHARLGLYLVVWAAFLGAAAVTAAALPLCYLPERAQDWAADQGPRLRAALDGPVFFLATLDSSGATVVAVTLFLGVLLRHLENRDLFAALEANLRGMAGGRGGAPGGDHRLVRALRTREPAKVPHRLDEFARRVYQETSLIQYENFLVVLGLLGTMSAFYLGFSGELRHLSYANLQATADNLLKVIGTATISSLVGIGLGMIFVRTWAERDAVEVDRIVALARETLGAHP